ncbi:MAG: GtrA family protein [Lysobacter sp.]
MLRVSFRYVSVQLFAYAMDIGVFLLLVDIAGTDALWANVAGKIGAGAFAFLAHRHFTFGAGGNRNMKSQLLRYVLLLAVNVPVSSAILGLLLQFATYAVAAKVASDAMCIGITFALSKYLVFVGPRRSDGGHV